MTLEQIKTFQRKILFGLNGYFDEKGNMFINPFYLQKEIKKKWEKDIQSIYKKLLITFVGFYFERHGNCDSLPPKKLVENFII